KNFPISEFRTDKIKENEANVFASEFLMPEIGIKNQLTGLSLKDLSELKKIWFTSMASIVRRAYDLKCIDQARYNYLIIELSRLGYRKNEPVEVYIDEPTTFMKGFELYTNELNYSIEEFSEAFKFPTEIVNDIFNVKRENKVK